MSDILNSCRVLDLSNERGQACGQWLADLGADVIQVEPLVGSRARRLGPFAEDSGAPNDSLSWWALNRNKRSLTLDLVAEEERETLRDLVRSADFLIESETPGLMEERGLDYASLRDLNPALIYVSITPFGLDGPKSHYADSDLIVAASSGALNLCGDEDRAPVRIGPVPQAYYHACLDAAIGLLAAHHERVRSGLGQHVSVSAQMSMALATQFTVLAAPWNSPETTRYGGGFKMGGLALRQIYPAKDGYVSLTFLSGSALGIFSRRFMEFAHEEGYCDEATRDKDWIQFGYNLLIGEESPEEKQRVDKILENFVASKTKQEWMRLALERNLLIVPVSNIADLVESPQLVDREYFQEIEHGPGRKPVLYPGAFAKMSDSPIRYRCRAPEIGEHNSEIREELKSRPPAAAPRTEAAASSSRPLEGVKILDFMWVMAGPIGTRMLTDLGATVIRIESPTRIDTGRTLGPEKDGVYSPERAGLFVNCNAGKLGLALELNNPASREIVLDLVEWADVVTESFSPRAMPKWELAYKDLVKRNPDLIMLSSCLMGQSGIHSKLMGYGTMGSAIAGFQEITGWPDRSPSGTFAAYTDYVACRFTAISILAALEHRRQTGRGQYIDQSQVESTTHLLTSAVLDYQVNGRIAQRMGNSDPQMAPHGVYAASGDDCWVAVACRSDEDWQGLCAAMQRPELATDPRFTTLAGRLKHSAELDQEISRWTASRENSEVEQILQEHQIPAHAVHDSAGFCADPQIAHMGHLVEVEHSGIGPLILEGPRAVLSRTPAEIQGPAPLVGEHSHQILQEILGYDEDRITELVIAGALG